jgi:hypothetical protein
MVISPSMAFAASSSLRRKSAARGVGRRTWTMYCVIVDMAVQSIRIWCITAKVFLCGGLRKVDGWQSIENVEFAWLLILGIFRADAATEKPDEVVFICPAQHGLVHAHTSQSLRRCTSRLLRGRMSTTSWPPLSRSCLPTAHAPSIGIWTTLEQASHDPVKTSSD